VNCRPLKYWVRRCLDRLSTLGDPTASTDQIGFAKLQQNPNFCDLAVRWDRVGTLARTNETRFGSVDLTLTVSRL
jgi:hypothetical protein